MTRVLFVDDDANVVQGLKRMVAISNEDWTSYFAASAEDAIELLAHDKFDIVVSDMQMPGFSGAELLEYVSTRHPETVRLILSGQSERKAVLESVGTAHQFLGKPCDAEVLFSVIRRAVALRSKLQDAAVARVVASVRCLPSLPSVYEELIHALSAEGSTVAEVGEIVSRDLGMASKVLQLVNSAFFGIPRRIDSVADAVGFLGVDTLRGLVIASGLFSAYTASDDTAWLAELLDHSMRTGELAKQIALAENWDKWGQANALTAGLMHDVGKLVMATAMKRSYDRARTLSEHDARPASILEREQVGASHSEIGGYLLGLWGFPDEVVEAVAYHHDPIACENAEFSLLTIVHAANGLVHEQASRASASSHFNEAYVATVGKTDRLESWRQLQQAA